MRKTLFKAVLLLQLAVFASLAFAQETVQIKRIPKDAIKVLGLSKSPVTEFSPAVAGGSIAIPFALDQDAVVSLDLLSADGDLVRRLADAKAYGAGQHAIHWDGRDDGGELVPDEAYVPLFKAVIGETTHLDDPRSYSGGEVIPNIQWQRSSGNSLSFALPDDARVLLRIGVKDGPMMRELRHWTPTVAGNAAVRWDGFDTDKVEKIADRDDLWVVVMAYQLPQYSVITSGNQSLDYRQYRAKRDWPRIDPKLQEVQLQREGVRLSRDYFLPRNYLPRVSLQFEREPELSRVGIPTVEDTVRFKISVPDEDRWILDSTFYETGLYIDYKFQSEEEQGFVPMIWQFDASKLAKGRHTATVQLFGFGGFISSSTLEFLKE